MQIVAINIACLQFTMAQPELKLSINGEQVSINIMPFTHTRSHINLCCGRYWNANFNLQWICELDCAWGGGAGCKVRRSPVDHFKGTWRDARSLNTTLKLCTYICMHCIYKTGTNTLREGPSLPGSYPSAASTATNHQPQPKVPGSVAITLATKTHKQQQEQQQQQQRQQQRRRQVQSASF